MKQLILPILAVVLLCATTGFSRRPNVIIIMTDDQGFADMSCHGNPYLQTPNIDQLFHDSLRLTDFHVDPTCSPTRSALLTGRYSTRVGVWLTDAGGNSWGANYVYLRQR